MDFSQNRNNQQRTSVNTRGLQFSNTASKNPSTLQFGYWDDFISLKMNPPLAENMRSETKFFDYNSVVTTALTAAKAQTIADKIPTVIYPALAEKKSAFVGVPVGGGKSLFGVGVHAEGDTAFAYAGIYKSLDENTKKPESFITYEFQAAYVVRDFNPETGEFDLETDIPAELTLFHSMLLASIQALSKANAHASRHVDKAWRDRVAGGEAPASEGRKGWGNSSSMFTKESAPKENYKEHNAPSTTINNLDELQQYMQ